MALDRRMWFGTKEKMVAIRAPKTGFDGSRVGWDGGVTQYLHGGAYVRRSTSSHKVYNFAWPTMTRQEVALITDYAEGVYGDGAIYFIDPFAMDKNLLPQAWATPRLVFTDGLVLNGAERPSILNNPPTLDSTLGYPRQPAQYKTAVGTDYPKLYIPIPPGHTAWFGAHGVPLAAANSPLVVLPNSGAAARVEIVSVNDSNRFTNSWDGSNNSGIELSFSGTNGVASIAGMMLQILPTGVLPMTGGFISGQGNSGVRFATNPTVTYTSAVMDMVGLSAQLVEDEAWR
jgi:hypothetical protein